MNLLQQNPLVSVYMPTKNRRDLLERALNSILEQTYSNLDVIVVDDGSTDDTVAFLETVVNNDQRVRFLVIKQAQVHVLQEISRYNMLTVSS